MENIGKTLRETRIRKGLDYEEIENQTKIRRKFIEAMENEEWDVFPGLVYLKGFMRTYARLLGLDEKELLSGLDTIIKPSMEAVPIPEKIELPGKPKRRMAFILGIIAILILVASQYVYQQYFGREIPVPQANHEAPPPQEEPQEKGTEAVQPPPVTVNDIKLVIRVINYKCWVEVKSEGQLLYQQTLYKGQEKSFEGLSQVSFTLGNAGDVEVYINEKSLGPLGKVGDVVNKSYVVKDNDIVEVTP